MAIKIPYFLGALMFAAVLHVLAGTEDTDNGGGITCRIVPNQDRYLVGDPMDLSVEILNNTDETVVLPGILDGSEAKWRYPSVSLEVTCPDGTSCGRRVLQDGPLNYLEADQFVEIAPGTGFNPAQPPFFGLRSLRRGVFSIEGEYRFEFTVLVQRFLMRKKRHFDR